jgi:hypothetical protein
MKGDKIRYKCGYKYQLVEDYTVATGITIPKSIATDWMILSENGILTIKAGYAWDGASGPTFDTPSSMRGSLVHDALYQLMRLGLLPISYREKADDLLHDICVEDGMIHLRAELWEEAVSHFAAGSADPKSEREVLEAP